MRPKDRELASRLDAALLSFDKERRPLIGIRVTLRRTTFIEQVLESIHRVRYVEVLTRRNINEIRGDPENELFDPLRAAILQQRLGNVEEAFWLVFLFVHFGKHPRAGWRYAREVYGRLGASKWDWQSTSADPTGFRSWLHSHQGQLKRPGVPRGFGNHRKYESLDAHSPNGTGSVVESYVSWVKPPRTHVQLIEEIYSRVGGDRRKTFDGLYESMKAVSRFGRTARFDYLTMTAKLGLAPIEAPSTYMRGSTGPVKGARLLFGGHKNIADLDRWLVEIDAKLHVGMQVLEDALCNWQKSPDKFKPFRG